MWKWFIEGIILLFPIALSCLIFIYLFELFSHPLDVWLESFFPALAGKHYTARLIALLMTLAFIVAVGFLGARWILGRVLKQIHALFLKIPIIRKVFHASHEVVNTMLREEDRGFQQFTLFPFGDTGGYAVSFLPRKDGQFEEHTAVLLPGTPNPLQGFMLYVENDKIALSELPIGAAMKWNISIGSADFPTI